MPRPFHMRPPDKPSKVVHLPNPILGYKIVEFGYHALERMEQRSVSEEDVLKALVAGRQVPGRQPPGKTRIRWNKTARLRIDVVYEKMQDRLGIVTVIPFGGGIARR